MEKKIRTKEPSREHRIVSLDLSSNAIPPSHPSRFFWELFGFFDLSPFLSSASSFVSSSGRSSFSPRLLLSLWALALSDGIVSSREIERKISSDVSYQWLVGDFLTVSHDVLSDFLAKNAPAFFSLFTQVLSFLQEYSCYTLDTIYVDGTKIRSSTGQNSFRTKEGLVQWQEKAIEQWESWERKEEPLSNKQILRKARAREMKYRAEQALDMLDFLQKKKQKEKTKAE